MTDPGSEPAAVYSSARGGDSSWASADHHQLQLETRIYLVPLLLLM